MSVATPRTSNLFVGSPIERLEDHRFLTGRGQYVDDLASERMLHAVILRSSVAHGHIRAIDTAAARARPGVHAVITAAERRSRGPPAAGDSPSKPTAAAAIPVKKITRAIGRSGSH